MAVYDSKKGKGLVFGASQVTSGMRPVFGRQNSNMVAASNTSTIFGSNADVKSSPLSGDSNAMTSSQFANVVTTGGRRRR